MMSPDVLKSLQKQLSEPDASFTEIKLQFKLDDSVFPTAAIQDNNPPPGHIIVRCGRDMFKRYKDAYADLQPHLESGEKSIGVTIEIKEK